TKRLTIEFSYTARDQRTVIDLGLFDPECFRGWSGGNKSAFTISEVDATPSYLPGPLPPGTWKLLLGIPNIRPGVQSEYTVKVFLAPSVDPAATFGVPPPVLRLQPGWYQGDLHTHTSHSDGSCTSLSGKRVPCPEFKLVEAAAARGLDFVAVTDHNTTSTYNALQQWQPYFDTLLLIRGREITTFQGHANIYGTSEFIDFSLGSDGRTVTTLLDEVHRAGAILSINHPQMPSGEDCMGCGWTPKPATDFAQVDAIEVVNGPDAGTRFSGISFWEEQLNQGHRITAIGGSDDHQAGAWQPGGRTLGLPTTVVYARELSEAGILDGIKAGHAYLKLNGPEGPAPGGRAGAGLRG
ncbi:MAG: CehA/McbA family metallohydrolase, partial [Chloroflexota bacterium]